MNLSFLLDGSQLRKYKQQWTEHLAHPEKNPLLDDAGLRRNSFVLENELCLYSQNPQFSDGLLGSGIIVTRAPRATLFDLTPEEWAATYSLLHEVKAHLDRIYRPDGYTVGWNVHPAGGQHIPQVHLHVIPRFETDLYAGCGIRYFYRQCVKQLAQELTHGK